MGVHQLSAFLREAGKRLHTLGDDRLRGGKIGIDLWILLHQVLGTKEGAEQAATLPRQPVHALISRLRAFIDLLAAHKITPVFVFDGMRHPNKAAEDDRRAAAADAAAVKLSAAYADATSSFEDVKKLRNKNVRVTEDMVGDALAFLSAAEGAEVLGAPFEADWQLAHLETTGYTCATYTEDSDLFALGSKVLITQLRVMCGDACSITIRDEVLQKEELGAGKWDNGTLLAFCARLGCDYIHRVLQCGPQKALEWANKWHGANAAARQGMLNEIETVGKWPKRAGGGLCEGYSQKFNETINTFLYAPVFIKGHRRWKLAPLNKLPRGKVWNDLIGFDPECALASVPGNIDQKATLGIWARTGAAPQSLELPKDGSGVGQPHGSVIDFGTCPVRLQPSAHLLQWLAHRAVPVPQCTSREFLIDTVTKCLAEPVQRPIIELGADKGHYVSWETMAVGEPALWEADVAGVLSFFRDRVHHVDEDFLASKFGAGRNGVRVRAFRRFASGHLDIDTCKLASVKLAASGEKVTIVKAECVPSMKSDIYDVFLVFSSTGDFMPTPTRCDCPNGYLFCSHVLGMLLLVRLIQEQTTWDAAAVRAFMPLPLKCFAGVPIAAELIFKDIAEEDLSADAAGRRAPAAKELGSGVAAIFRGYAAAGGGGGGSDGEDSDAGSEDAADVSVESSAHEHDDGGRASLDICAKVDAMVVAAAAGGGGGGGGATAGRKYSADRIAQHNAARVGRVLSADKVQRQRERLERFDRYALAGAGELREMQLFSHTEHFRDDRRSALDSAGSVWAGDGAGAAISALLSKHDPDSDY